MKTTNTRKYHNIRKAIQSIHGWRGGAYSNGYTEIAYDPTEDKVLYEEHVGDGSYTVWADGIIRIGNYAGKDVTMAQIKADIETVLAGK